MEKETFTNSSKLPAIFKPPITSYSAMVPASKVSKSQKTGSRPNIVLKLTKDKTPLQNQICEKSLQKTLNRNTRLVLVKVSENRYKFAPKSKPKAKKDHLQNILPNTPGRISKAQDGNRKIRELQIKLKKLPVQDFYNLNEWNDQHTI